MRRGHAVLQARYGVVAASIADDEAVSAVVVAARRQGRGIHGGHLLGAAVGDTLNLPVGRHDASTGLGAVLVGTGVQGGGQIGRGRNRSTGFHRSRTAQTEAVDGRVRRDGRLKGLRGQVFQDCRDGLARHFLGGRAVFVLRPVADAVVIARQHQVLAHDDLVSVHVTGHRFPRLAGVLVRRLLVLLVADDGGHNEHIARLRGDVGVRREVRLDDAAVGCGQVRLRALIESAAAQPRQGRGQLLVGDIAVEVNRGVVQPLYGAIHQSVDVVEAGLGVFHEVQDVLLRFLRSRYGFGLLERSVTSLGDSRQILLLDTGRRVFKSLKACEFRGVVCHLIAPLNGLCRLLRGSRPQRGRLRPAWIPCLRWRPCRRG